MAGIIWQISNLTVGIVCLILVIILLRYGAKREHYVWAFFSFIVTIWGFGAFLVGFAKTNSIAMICWKIALAGATLTPIVLYHFVVALGKSRRLKTLAVFYSYGIVTIFLTLFNLAGLKIVYIYDAIYYVRATDVRWVFIITVWTSIIFYAIFELYRLFHDATGSKRLQFQYLLVGLGTGFVGAIINTLPFFGFDIFPIGNILICFYCILVTYAILRHQLLDIEVIVKKTLVFAGLLAAVFTILILPTLLIQEYILRAASFGSRLIGLTISGVIIILTMRRIETFLINVTDKYLFQKKYDYKELLKTFTTEVLTVLELDTLVGLTISKLTDIVKLASCAVLLFDDEKQQFNVMASQGVKDPSVTLIRPDGIVTFMDETHGYILVKELHQKKISIPAQIQEIVDKLNAELIIPMVMHDDVIGVLSLGKKKSDEDYTQDDLDILLPLSRTLAIAISNAQLFVELGKTQAEAAQREKMAVIGTLSAGINHEICNPLGIARGQCEAFLLNVKDGLYKAKTNEELLMKAKDIMVKVIKETDRATSITKKLSGFAKPAKGEAEIVNVGQGLDEVVSLVGYELKLDKIEFEKHIEQNLPAIFVDKKQFEEVLFNLIRNAGQAIKEKGRITVSAYHIRDKVFIDVKDTGSGIPEDKIKQLFNPFFTTKDPGKGTGLGLFIVRQIIEKNGGRIYLKETKEGEGTTFELEFPAATAAEAKQGK